jgi:hypothetical protein
MDSFNFFYCVQRIAEQIDLGNSDPNATGNSSEKFNPSNGDFQTVKVQPFITSFFLVRSVTGMCMYVYTHTLRNKTVTFVKDVSLIICSVAAKWKSKLGTCAKNACSAVHVKESGSGV